MNNENKQLDNKKMTENTGKNNEKKLEELFKTELQKQFLQGIKGGMLVVSQTVLDKLNDTSKPLVDRIADIKKCCNSYISLSKGTGQK